MIELLEPAEMAEADRLTIAGGMPGIVLMRNAGRAIADCAARHPLGTPVTVVCGPGNNGGDGFVAARILSERGYRVRVLLVGDRDRLQGDAATAAAEWKGAIEQATPEALDGARLIVDALFGAGLDRAVEGLPRAMIEAVNRAGVPVIAVDLPSGVNGKDGSIMGAAVKATETVTFFRRKPGHVLLPGRLHCGPVRVADIGIPARVLEAVRPRTFINNPELWGKDFPVPRIDGHKYMRGHAVVVSGDLAHSGAARLAAYGALRAGAGLVTIASPQDALAVNAAAHPSIMVRPVNSTEELGALLADERKNAVVLGPGGGVDLGMRERVELVLSGRREVVLDADALTVFAQNAKSLYGLLKNRSDAPTIFTPHLGEFSRFFKEEERTIIATHKVDLLRRAANESLAVWLLKGADTIVAAPDGRVARNRRKW
jgi:hydroxyethylthiazole kinase-like uncharacterized protein yjeF